jgi:Tol biopolymer transport system component
MTGRWAAAIAVIVAALALAIGVAVSSGSGSSFGVAYVTGAQDAAPSVWFANADGSHPHRLGPGDLPLVAPDGSIVAASQGPGLVLYSTSGAGTHRYFGSPKATAVATAFSPDSRYLAVVLASTDPASAADSGLAVIDTTTFGYRIVAHGQIYGAGFAPDGSDRIAYAAAPSPALTAPVDVHVIGADGSGSVQLTHDGRSLNPVWSEHGIAFDGEQLRPDAEPAYEVWTMARDGSAPRRLTALSVPALRDGLVPLSVSNDGRRLLAEYVGQDTSQAWLVTLAGGHAVSLGAGLAGAALSRSGGAALVVRGGVLGVPDQGVIESMPLNGGPARVLAAHGSEPSWNV